MKLRRLSIAIFAILSTGFFLSPRAEALTVKDKLGNTVEVETPVERAVFMSLYELIPVLHIWDKAVGINRWAFDNPIMKQCPELKKVPSVGTGDQTNVETILSLRPDLVVTCTYKPETAAFLAGKGLKVIVVYPESMKELRETMELCGLLFEKEQRAKEVLDAMEGLSGLIRSRTSSIPESRRRKVLWLWSKSTAVSGSVGIQQDLFDLIGAVNPARHLDGRHPEVSLEHILVWNPDVIFIWGSAKYGPQDLYGSPQWKSVAAVRERRVFKAPVWSSWSPAVDLLALWMARKVYPELFGDSAPLEAARLFHKTCFGVDVDESDFD